MRILLIFLFNLSWVSCSLIPSPNPKIKLGEENVELGSFDESKSIALARLITDTLTSYSYLYDSSWINYCKKDRQWLFRSSSKFKQDINQSLFLPCDFSDFDSSFSYSSEIEKFDTLCDMKALNVLYSPMATAFFIGDVADLKKESKRYALKSFLSKNNMKLPNTEMAFVYLYHTYANFYFYACGGSLYFYPIDNFKQIPLPLVKYHDDARGFSIIRADYDLFQAEMEKALQKHQSEAKHYFCGAIRGRNRNEGKWELYFFVVDERNPIDYEVYAFQTPKRECYTWKGSGAYGGEYGMEDFLDDVFGWAK